MIKSDPLVTIGVPFYNPGQFLELAIRSVFSQTYKNWELILVDDGSTDNSLELCKKIKDSRVKVLSDGKNKGRPHRRNQIIRLAKGKYIAWLDADDIMHPQRIEKQVSFMEEHLDIDAVASGAYLIDLNNKVVGLRVGKKPSVIDIFSRGGYIHPTLFGKTTWFLENPYDEAFTIAEDRELLVRTSGIAKIDVIEEPLYFYRWIITPEKLTEGYSAERIVMFKYGPKKLGWLTTSHLVLKSFSKTLIVKLLTLLKQKDLLVELVFRRGSVGLSQSDRIQAENIIEQIKAQEVNGWD